MHWAKLKYVPILLFVAKIFTYLIASRILFPSATYFAPNSAGKIYQGLVKDLLNIFTTDYSRHTAEMKPQL